MKSIIAAAAIGTAALALAGCDVEQTEEGDMPEIEAEGGNLPEYDVDAADVDVDADTTTTEVEVPTLDVDVAEPGEEANAQAED